MTSGVVIGVHRSAGHTFSKATEDSIRLLAGLGVEGDAHLGVTVQHRSRVAMDPTQPNLRQVHLLHSELFEELATAGFVVKPGELGENVTTRGLDLLGLPRGTRLRLGESAIDEVTGLRNPCVQINEFRAGLLGKMVSRDEHGGIVRKGGIMSVVLVGGVVQPGDAIGVELPMGVHEALGRV